MNDFCTLPSFQMLSNKSTDKFKKKFDDENNVLIDYFSIVNINFNSTILFQKKKFIIKNKSYVISIVYKIY